MLSGNSSITVNGDEGLAGLAGLAGGTTTISGLGGVGGLIVLQPQGSYVTLSKYLSMGERRAVGSPRKHAGGALQAAEGWRRWQL